MTLEYGASRSIRIGVGLAVVALVTGLTFAAPAAATAAPAASSTTVHARLEINRATKGALVRLPGIGEAYAQKIIDGRPYKSTDELVSRKILPKEVYEGIASRIVAHRW